MVTIPAFSTEWPISVTIRRGVAWHEGWSWMNDKADELGIEARDLYTSFTNRDFGFKDKALAMEFKLRFG